MIQCEYEILINRLLFPRKYIDFKSNLSKKEVYGFKLQSHHLDLQKIGDASGFIQNLYNSGYRIIKLTRRNLYRTALSLTYARTSGKFHYTTASNDQPYPKIRIDPEEVLIRIQWMESQQILIDQVVNHIPHLSLVYEDHLIDELKQQATANHVFGYFDLPNHEVKTNFVKMNSEDISLYVENAEEIRNLISPTKYGDFLDQGY